MSYLTTPTSFIAVDGTKIAYRELSPGASRLPLVMLVHLAANLDNWDPRLVDQLANDRHLILLDLPGVGASSGTVPPTLEEAGEQAARIVRGLGHDRVDLLGLSMGGMIAQEVVRHDPELVERLILVGTGPRAGLGIDKVTPTTFRHMFRAALKRKDPKRYIFYTRDAHGEAVANEVLGRLGSRTAQYADKAVTVPSFLRQLRAIKRWGASPADDLSHITMPTLIVNGDTDDMVPTPNSYDMHKRIAGSRLVIYPHAGHGSLFQHAEEFTTEVNGFLADTAANS